jgi:HK97 family phage prohead protease
VTASLPFEVEWKSTDASGELTGYMSVFGNLDQDGDVVLPGAFKKTFDGWNRAKTKLPLIADHQLSTDGVIGSVTHMAEDGYGAKIRARFSSIAKAQDIRTRMIEGHLNGLSYTYAVIRSHRGLFEGKSARFLDELRVFEATVSPFPVNQLALASAKGGTPDYGDDLAQLEELERWAEEAMGYKARRDLADLANASSATFRNIADVKARAEARTELQRLEAWALSQPRRQQRDDPNRAARARAATPQQNAYSFGLAATMDRLKAAPPCGHGCPAGMCRYPLTAGRPGTS